MINKIIDELIKAGGSPIEGEFENVEEGVEWLKDNILFTLFPKETA